MWCNKNLMYRIVGAAVATACLLAAWRLGVASEPGTDSRPPQRVEAPSPDAEAACETDDARTAMPWPFADEAWPFGRMPGWRPFWAPVPPCLPFASPIPFAMPEPKAAPVDPGTLRVEETIHTDQAAGPYMVRRRSWTSGGVPHHEVTVIAPPPAGEECAPDPDAEESRQEPAYPGTPELEEQSNTAAQPADCPPSENPAVVKPGRPARQSAPAIQRQGSAVGVAVSADSRQGVRIQHHIEGCGTSTKQGFGATAVGGGVDSRGGVRVYQYHAGADACPPGRR